MKKYIFLTILGGLILGYQNFGALTADDLKMAEALNDLKQLAGCSAERPMIATPQSGNSIEGVRNDWIQRQGSLWINGADQRLLDTINEKITNLMEDEKPKVEPVKSAGRQPASVVEEKPAARFPASVRFTRINAMDIKLFDNTRINASWENDGAHVDYSQKISDNTQIGIGHKTMNSETQFLLNYKW
jgi:hypothetical protein